MRRIAAIVTALALALGGPPPAAGAQDSPAPPDSAGLAPAPSDSAGAAAEEAPPDSVGRAAADTSVRVTGAPFRFGGTPEMAQRHGEFATARRAGRDVVRSLAGSWFGIPGEYALAFRDGRLRRVEFTAGRPSARALDYAADQLRSSGFRRVCGPPTTAGATVCDWTGRTRVRLETSPVRLFAVIEPPPAPRPRTAPPAVAIVPHTFILARAAAAALPAPEPVASPPPDYPAAARADGLQGNVWVRALVDTSGAVLRAAVTRGIPELDTAAVAAARRWRFRPYLWNGAPARFEVEFPVRFVLGR